MLEGAAMEYVKWMIGLISASFIATAVIFMLQLNAMNTFQQEVNYQIERHGGLTSSAMNDLNEYAKENHGGCIVESSEDNAPCWKTEDRDNNVESSGLFVSEFTEKPIGEGYVYKTRLDGEKARYGTPIDYVLTRQIGQIKGISVFKPTVIGESASRVRGDVDA